MLVQPKKRISAPHSLLDPWVPGRLLPSGQWGINRAAVFAFPDLGMLVLIPAWAKKDIGDTVKLLLDGREVDGRPIINKSELEQPTVLSVAPRHLQTGSYELTYEIKQPNQKEERPDKPLDLFVKLELPGGQDINPGPGHSNLYMYIPPEIVNGGVDKDVAEAGVPIVIRSESGSGLPYPYIAVDDVIRLYWGGTLVESTPVTQAQIDDPVANPILIWITKAIIERVGDTDDSGLAVTFKVRDKVDNESEDWCKETRIVVTVGIDRLDAPIVQDAFNNKLDVDKQGNNDITVEVTAARSGFQLNDIIHLTMFGTTVDGEEVKVPAPTQIVDNLPHNYHFKLPIADVRKLVNTQVTFSYHLVRNGSNLPLSKGQFVDFEGVAHRLAAPTVKEAVGDFIDPGNKEINIRIPFDPLIEIDNAIELFLLGKSPDGSNHLPDLGYYFPDEKDLANPDGFTINVADDPLEPINGGNLEVWYHLLKDKGAEITRQESVHARVLNVGEPQFELNAPMVKGVENHFLEPGNLPGGTTEMTIYKPLVRPWVIDDEAQWFWEGDVSGGVTGSIKFNALTVRQDWLIRLDAEFVAKHIEPNRGSKITVRYQLWRHATEETSLSNPLVFTVGVALELLAPWIKENNGDSALNPLLVRDTLTAVVPDNPELRPTDEIIVTWTGAQGTPAGGSHTSVPRPLGSNREFAIPNSVVAFNLNKDVKVSYVVIRDGKPLPSLVFDLTVLSMPQNELLKPIIKDADNNGEGPEFNVGKLTANAIYRMGIWPLIAPLQYVWLRLTGTNADGSDYNLQIHTAPGSYVTDGWITQGYLERNIALAGLRNLKDGSTLTMAFKAAFGKDPNESLAVPFPVRTYTVVTRGDLDLEPPTIKENNGDSTLNPVLVKDTLTVVVPDNAEFLPTYEISVRWDGAVGTPAGGSHTSVPRAVSEGLEFAIPNSVVAFNLGKRVKVSYVVIIDGHPTPSRVFELTVQAMPQSALASPTIVQADSNGSGPELKTGNLTRVTVRMGDWPLIAPGQYVWLRLRGTNADGSAYAREIWSAPNNVTDSGWITNGFFTSEIEVAEIKNLQDGSNLALEFKAALGQSTVESEAVLFPVRTYTIKTLVDEKPEITRAEDDKGVEILEGATTKSTVITLKGTASKGQKVQIKDGTTVKGDADVDPTTGRWELTMRGLSVDNHRFTATALYGEGKISDARTLKIIPNPITIDPATMVLGGIRLINDYGWERRAETNTVKRRVATGGVAPYTYTSANSAIASVSNNGTVTGFRQGSTTITVTDKNGDQGQFTVRCNEIKIYKVVKSLGLMAGTYEAITGWIRSVGGLPDRDSVRAVVPSFNDEYPDARIVLGPPYPSFPGPNLRCWGYHSHEQNQNLAGLMENHLPPNDTSFMTYAGFLGEQRVPGYVFALVPV